MSNGDPGIYAEPREVTDIAQCYFYHTIDLPMSGTIKGTWDLRPRIRQYLGNVDFRGKRVLDVGAANGILSFWIERQGAIEVISYDLDKTVDWDLVPFVKWSGYDPIAHEEKHIIDKLNNAYWFAHRLLNSNAKVVYGSVYDIPREIGMVDVSVFGCILLHLRDPFLALQKGLSLTRETVIVTEELRGAEAGDPSMVFLPDAKTLEPKDAWWSLKPELVVRMLGVLGFEDADITYHDQLYEGLPIQLYTVVGRRTSQSHDGELLSSVRLSEPNPRSNNNRQNQNGLNALEIFSDRGFSNGGTPGSDARFPSHTPLVWISDTISENVGVRSVSGMAGWGLEQEADHSFLWIGQGEAQGARLDLWSRTDCVAELRILVHAGPARSDVCRTVTVRADNARNPQQTSSFKGSATVRFPIGLAEGRNKVLIFAEEAPNREVPGDSRPLIVRLEAIRIAPRVQGDRQAVPGNAPLITLDNSIPSSQLRFVSDLTGPWAVESSGGHSWLWLGCGKDEGLTFSLWSQAPQHLVLKVSALAGPCRDDQLRNLQLEVHNAKGQLSVVNSLSSAGIVQFELPIAAGVNRISLFVLDRPTRKIATDSRTLLVRVNHIVLSSRIQEVERGEHPPRMSDQ